MKEFALALSAMTVSHHGWPMKPPPEPAAIERPAPVQTRYVDQRELRKAIDRYCREQKRLNKSARRSTAPLPHVRHMSAMPVFRIVTVIVVVCPGATVPKSSTVCDAVRIAPLAAAPVPEIGTRMMG